MTLMAKRALFGMREFRHSPLLTGELCMVASSIIYPGMQKPQSTENGQLPGQKHFLKAYSLIISDKPNKIDVHMNWQTYSPVKRELSLHSIFIYYLFC